MQPFSTSISVYLLQLLDNLIVGSAAILYFYKCLFVAASGLPNRIVCSYFLYVNICCSFWVTKQEGLQLFSVCVYFLQLLGYKTGGSPAVLCMCLSVAASGNQTGGSAAIFCMCLFVAASG